MKTHTHTHTHTQLDKFVCVCGVCGVCVCKMYINKVPDRVTFRWSSSSSIYHVWCCSCCAVQKFSKVSALVYLLYKVTIEHTLENLCLDIHIRGAVQMRLGPETREGILVLLNFLFNLVLLLVALDLDRI